MGPDSGPARPTSSAGDHARFPLDHLERRQMLTRRGHGFRMRDPFHQEAQGDLGDLVLARIDGRERGQCVPGLVDVVEPDHRDVIGDAQASLLHDPHGTERDRVVEGHHAVEARARSQQRPQGLRTARAEPSTDLADERLVVGDACLLKGLTVSVKTQAGRADDFTSVGAERHESPATDGQQVLGCGLRTLRVAHRDMSRRTVEDALPEQHHRRRDTLEQVRVVRAVQDGRGLGVFYWDPTWTGVVGNGWSPRDPSSGNAWENQALFGFDDRPLPAMSEFKP